MDKSLLIIASSFIISVIITPLVILYSVKKGLFVTPGRRKIHKRITPSLGGIGIFFGFFIVSLVALQVPVDREVQLVLVFVSLMFILGIIDDLFNLSALKKLVPQLLIIMAFVFFTDIRFKSFYGLFNTPEFPYVVSFAVTVFVMIIIINSLNLIDGIDGLAGMISIISSLSFASWFFITGNFTYAYLLFALFGGIAAFIIFNWEPSKIFMGDTGSLVIGMILSIAAIKFTNLNFDWPSSPYHFHASITSVICFLIIPLVDTTRIVIFRLSKGQSPLKPDKNHIHHTLIKLGASHSQAALLLGFVHIAIIIIAVFFRDAEDFILLPCLIVFCAILCFLLDRRIIKRLTIK